MTHYEHPLFKDWESLCKKTIVIQRKEGFTEEYQELRAKMKEIAQEIKNDLKTPPNGINAKSEALHH